MWTALDIYRLGMCWPVHAYKPGHRKGYANVVKRGLGF